MSLEFTGLVKKLTVYPDAATAREEIVLCLGADACAILRLKDVNSESGVFADFVDKKVRATGNISGSFFVIDDIAHINILLPSGKDKILMPSGRGKNGPKI